MPGGRPTKYKKEYCKGLIDFMSNGRSFTAYAAKLKVSRETLYCWERDNPEFLDAKRHAYTACEAWWEKQGMDGLWDEENGPKLNASKWIFNMKARFGWRDKEPDVVINNPPPQQVSEGMNELKAMISDLNRPLSEKGSTRGLLEK